MAYPVYRALFEHYVNFVTNAQDADIVVLGHPDDFNGLAPLLRNLVKVKPQLKLYVISEEPLWDSTWKGDFTQLQNEVMTEHGLFNFYYLNYVTTTVFHFHKLPYFITTKDDYFVRYQMLFNRNSQRTAAEIVQHWRLAAKACFMAQKRTEALYDVSCPAVDLEGLSRYRTLIAEGLQGPDVLVSGQGWTDNKRRQTLPDWHLAKLTETDQRYFIMSSVENTHLNQYVTEKLFDAFATLSLPVYYASSQHAVTHIVPAGSFINLHGYSINDAIALIRTQHADSINMSSYVAAQQQLAERFSCADVLLSERLRIVRRLMHTITALR